MKPSALERSSRSSPRSRASARDIRSDEVLSVVGHFRTRTTTRCLMRYAPTRWPEPRKSRSLEAPTRDGYRAHVLLFPPERGRWFPRRRVPGAPPTETRAARQTPRPLERSHARHRRWGHPKATTGERESDEDPLQRLPSHSRVFVGTPARSYSRAPIVREGFRRRPPHLPRCNKSSSVFADAGARFGIGKPVHVEPQSQTELTRPPS